MSKGTFILVYATACIIGLLSIPGFVKRDATKSEATVSAIGLILAMVIIVALIVVFIVDPA